MGNEFRTEFRREERQKDRPPLLEELEEFDARTQAVVQQSWNEYQAEQDQDADEDSGSLIVEDEAGQAVGVANPSQTNSGSADQVNAPASGERQAGLDGAGPQEQHRGPPSVGSGAAGPDGKIATDVGAGPAASTGAAPPVGPAAAPKEGTGPGPQAAGPELAGTATATMAGTAPPASTAAALTGALASDAQVAVAHAAFQGSAASVRGQLDQERAQVDTSIERAAASALDASTRGAQQLRQRVQSSLAGLRNDISGEAQSTRAALDERLAQRKKALAEASASERDRVVGAAAEQYRSVAEKVAELAADARIQGEQNAAAIEEHAATQTALAGQAAAQVATQYKGHDRANDIRITVARMAGDTGKAIIGWAKKVADALRRDGEDLARKIEDDGKQYLDNLGKTDDEAPELFAQLLQQGEAQLDGSHAEAVAKVDEVETEALAQVDQIDAEVLGQIDGIEGQQRAGIEAARDEARAALYEANDRAVASLESQKRRMNAYVASAPAREASPVRGALITAAQELKANGGQMVAELAAVRVRAVETLSGAGCETEQAFAEAGAGFDEKLAEVAAAAQKKFAEVVEGYDAGLAEQSDVITGEWKGAADEKIAQFETAATEAKDGLAGTHRDGVAEMASKREKVAGEISASVAKLPGEMRKKADDLANESLWDRALSVVGNLALGLLDAVVEFIAIIGIAVLVIVAAVIIIGAIILLVGGVGALLAAIAAVVSVFAAIVNVLVIIGLVLLAIGIIFSIVRMVSSWMNPNLTSGEKWRATGKGIGEIALEFVPFDELFKLAKRADDAADAVRAIDNAADGLHALDNAADGAKALDDVADGAKAVDGTGDALKSGDELAEGARDGAKAADDVLVSGKGPQKTTDIDELYAQAAVAQEELNGVTKGLANELGGRPVIPPTLKGRPRAMEKINADYGGDASRISDLARSSVEFERLEDVYAALDKIEGGFEVIKKKDRFGDPTPEGYRDILLNIRMSNGHVVEIQLHMRQILEVKGGPGHKIYEEIRSLKAAAKTEGRALRPDELQRIDELTAESKSLYGAAITNARTGGGPKSAQEQLVSGVRERAEHLMQTQSNRVRGPVVSGVRDPVTSRIFYGQNKGIPPDLHPILQRRLEALLEQTGGRGLGKGTPGVHSEIDALNQALRHREELGLTVTEASLEDFIFHNLRLRGAAKGQPIKRCDNCAYLTSGARSLSD